MRDLHVDSVSSLDMGLAALHEVRSRGDSQCPLRGRFTVLIADFLDEASIELPVLDDIATVALCRATHEDHLADRLPAADAIILFHDIPHLGEASFALTPGASAWSAQGWGITTSTLRRPAGIR